VAVVAACPHHPDMVTFDLVGKSLPRSGRESQLLALLTTDVDEHAANVAADDVRSVDGQY
jgi:hypothetical protein